MFFFSFPIPSSTTKSQIYSIIHLFIKYIENTYYTLANVLTARGTKMNMTLTLTTDFKLFYTIAYHKFILKKSQITINYYTASKEILQLVYEKVDDKE